MYIVKKKMQLYYLYRKNTQRSDRLLKKIFFSSIPRSYAAYLIIIDSEDSNTGAGGSTNT